MKSVVILLVLAAIAIATPSGSWSEAANMDKTWYSDSGSTFTLTTAAQLAGLQSLIKEDDKTFAGKTITLGADIDLGAHYWPPLGYDYFQANGRKPFKGIFDGNNHEIKNFEIKDYAYVSSGFFASLDSATIKNTKFTGSVTISGTSAFTVGCAAGYAYASKFVNVISSCVVSVSTTNSPYIGGVAGKAESSSSFDKCRNIGTVQITAASSGSGIAGGIVGVLGGTVINSANTGYVKGNTAGGIVGYGTGITVKNCFNTGPLDGARSSTNGITVGSGTIVNCYNSGSFSGINQVASSASHAYGSSEVSASYVTQSCSESCGTFDSSGALTAISGSSVYYSTLVEALNGWISGNEYSRWRTGSGDIPADFSISITITLNPMGGTISTTQLQKYSGDTFGSIDPPVKSGFYFDGWFTDSSGGSKIEPTTVITQTADFTIFAHWLANVSVTLDPRGGSVNPTSIYVIHTKTYGFLTGLPSATLANNHFEGWFSSNNTRVTNDTIVDNNETHTLHAEWKVEYYVTFYTYPGSSTTGCVVTYLEGSTLGTLPESQRENYEFQGWFTQQEGGEQVTSSYPVSSSFTIYEHWAEIVTVTFDPNGGQTSQTSKRVVYGKQYGDLPTATREGHDFKGWFISKTSETPVTRESLVDTKNNHTLYALWQVKQYTLSFDTQGGSEIAPKDIDFGQTINWDSYVTEKSGYVFAGWFCGTADCKTAVVTMPSSPVQAVAHWGKYITISFNACGGTVSPTSQQRVSSSVLGNELPVPVKEGYEMIGWFTQCEGGSEVPSSAVLGENDITLYSHWTRKTFYVIFETNGGEVIQPMPFLFEGTITGIPTALVKEGYAFSGWYEDVQLTQKFTRTTMPANNVTVYAKWDEAYKISFNGNGGSVSKEHFYLAKGMLFGFYGSLPNATRDGYSFDGWFTEPGSQGIKITENTEFTTEADLTVYAHWIVNKYMILFETNGGSAVAPLVFEFGASIVITEVKTEKEGSAFGGWYMDSLLTQAMNISVMPSHNITLYARWIQSYKIMFNSAGGTCEVQYVYLASGMTYGTYGTLPVATKVGHTFNGWFTAESGGTKITETMQFTEDHDITLYAQWTVNEYTLAFNTNGGTSLPSVRLHYGSAISTPTNTEKEGFVFDGWFLDSGLVHAMNLTTMPDHDVTLYARWKKVESEKDAWDKAVVIATVIPAALALIAGIYSAVSCLSKSCQAGGSLASFNIFLRCHCCRYKKNENSAGNSNSNNVPLENV